MTNIPSLGDRSNGSHLDSISITYDDVLNELNRLSETNKSCDPDNCHSCVLKEIKDGLILPLYLLFAKSLLDGVHSNSWKDATVTAIHKKGNRKLASNYRSISLTSIFCRMLESIVKTKNNVILHTEYFFLFGTAWF